MADSGDESDVQKAGVVVRIDCVNTAEAVCMCALVEGRASAAPRSLFYALNGLGSMTALVCSSHVLRSLNIRRAVFCDRARTELRVSPEAILPYLRLCWINDRGKFDFSRGLLINHFSNEDIVTQKHRLAQRLLKFQETHATRRLHPDTFDLSHEDQVTKLTSALATESDSVRYWIVKPVDDSSGRGISVVRSVAELRERYADLHGHVAQRYIRQPLLLEGKYKFNTRIYLVIAQLKPLHVYWHPGYITKAIAPFDLADTSLKNLCAHVSNTRLQKMHPDFAAKKDQQKWTWPEFRAHVVDVLHVYASVEDFERRVERVIAAKLAALVLSVRDELDTRPGQFALFGVDFLFEASGEALLIECNKAPSHSASHRGDHSEEATLVPAIVDDVLAAAIALQEGRAPQPKRLRAVDLSVLERRDEALFGQQ